MKVYFAPDKLHLLLKVALKQLWCNTALFGEAMWTIPLYCITYLVLYRGEWTLPRGKEDHLRKFAAA